ncbi:lysozyme inhibitor LprI family protein [Jannaschia sp. KMU-145]|uniref:lysozyme inhibitor LprI family protein n=1 Tax=Jannaschia halovivens TaxID=3388667 RepID=UPI00396B0C80
MIRAVGLVVLLAAPAAAQDLSFSPAATEACLAAGAGPACIGVSANLCMTETPGGSSTVGTGGCLWAEAEYWDDRLNAAYGALRADARAVDAEMRDLGSAAPSQAEALREMQRAWMSFRDAGCAYEASLWGGGTGAGPASNGCWMLQTGRQALDLEDRLAERSR